MFLTPSWRRRERRTWPAGGHMTHRMGRCDDTSSSEIRRRLVFYLLSVTYFNSTMLSLKKQTKKQKTTTCSCSLYCISPVTMLCDKMYNGTHLLLLILFILSPTTAEMSLCWELFINESVPRLIQMYCRNNFTKNEDCVFLSLFLFSSFFFFKWM